jgi:hypothetical protein
MFSSIIKPLQTRQLTVRDLHISDSLLLPLACCGLDDGVLIAELDAKLPYFWKLPDSLPTLPLPPVTFDLRLGIAIALLLVACEDMITVY